MATETGTGAGLDDLFDLFDFFDFLVTRGVMGTGPRE